MSGKITLKTVLVIMACVAVILGVTTYFIIFGTGTQVVQPTSTSSSTSSSVRHSSSLFHSILIVPWLGQHNKFKRFRNNVRSIFLQFLRAISGYLVGGQSSFAIAGATLTGNELTLLINVAVGSIPQCVPINLRLISDEEGDMAAPTSPIQTNFPLSTSTCEGTSNTTYPSEPLTFTVDPANTPFLFLTGGTSNVYFEATPDADGGLDVAIPQQSG